MQTLTEPASEFDAANGAPDHVVRPSRPARASPAARGGAGSPAPDPVPETVPAFAWASVALDIQQEASEATRFTVLGAAWTRALAQHLGAAQVTLAWRRRGDLKLVAAAPLRPGQFSAARRRALLLAMDEACDQQVTLASSDADPRSEESAHIVLAQQALARRFEARGVLVVSVPLPHERNTVGALNLVWTGDAARSLAARQESLLAMLERHATTMTQSLRLARAAERPWPARMRHRLRYAPRDHRRRLMAGAGLALVATLALLTPFERHLNLDARLQGAIERQVAAPDDGSLAEVHVRPGDRVRAGAVLATLTDRELRLERDRLLSELAQHQGRVDAAMAVGDRTELSIAQSLIAQTQAQLARHETRLSEARVRAPIDGVVLDGEIWQLEGTPVTRGQALFTLAPEHAYRVVIDIDEAARSRLAAGSEGILRIQGIAAGALPFSIDRISPVAVERESAVVFEAHARLRSQHPDLRAGMRGIAQVRTEPASLLGRWTERVRQRLLLVWWRWQP